MPRHAAHVLFNRLVPKDVSSRRVARDVPYGSHPRQRFDVYAPRKGSGPLPVVVFIYGGAWSEGDRRDYVFAGRALSALGYLTFVPDYRVLPEVEYPGFLEDLGQAVAAVPALAPRFGGAPGRVALVGHSAGAYNAVMLGLMPQRFGVPAGLVTAIVGMSGPYDFFPFDGPVSMRTFGAVEDPRDTQPIAHVGPDAPPMLLVHGGRDPVVRPENSRSLGRHLAGRGIEAEVIVYDRLAHAGPLIALALPLRGIAPVHRAIGMFLSRRFAAPRAGGGR